MEEGAHVWLRSKSSHWGWVPARIIQKTTGSDTTQLTFEDDGSGHYDDIKPFQETLEFDANALQSMELEDVKMRNMDSERAVTQGSFRLTPRSAAASGRALSSSVVGGVDDLIGLMHLHEPAILHSLRIRYDKDIIYTNTGPILIAINPFKAMPKLYSKEGMELYRVQGEQRGMVDANSPTKLKSKSDAKTGDSTAATTEGKSQEKRLPPHVYRTADDAYRAMIRGMEDSNVPAFPQSPVKSNSSEQETHINQSILVSGESGAGKTVTTKIVLNYFAVLSRRRSQSLQNGQPGTPPELANGSNVKTPPRMRQLTNQMTGVVMSGRDFVNEKSSIEQQVLQSNPILEAFGNARTIRNDNSSRFGKFIEVRFNAQGKLCGGSIETYLLEKVRLIHPSVGERNYHVFYQLLAAITPEERRQLKMEDVDVEDFKLLSQSGVYERRDGVRDVDNHEEMVEAMQIVNFPSDAEANLMHLVAAVLWAGNVGFKPNEKDHGESCHLMRNLAAINLAKLLGVTLDALEQALTCKKLNVAGEIVTKPLQEEQSIKATWSLQQAVYGAAFDWIVMLINESIDVHNTNSTGVSQRQKKNQEAYIGVLDIFGFEVFDSNNYEQLCINYTNETLQQQFNKFVFKLEQLEYEREGILWKFIPFPDNQDVIDLIDKRRTGILSIVDEQCCLPRATDANMYNYICKGHAKHTRFQVTNLQKPRNKFSIYHYAGLVEYSTENWLEKNRDELPLATTELLLGSNFTLMDDIRMFIRGAPKRNSLKLPSVGAQFSRQLSVLRKRIDGTSPHYIRCLKPNDLLVANNFDPKNIVEQLRYGGVLEAVRVSRAGYPTRYAHDVFVARYYILNSTFAATEGASSGRKKKKTKRIVYSSLQEELTALVKSITKTVFMLQLSELEDAADSASQSPTSTQRKGWLFRSQSKKRMSNNKAMLSKRLSLNVAMPTSMEHFLSQDFATQCACAGFQVGKTKVFLRREAYEVIEGMRTRRFHAAACLLQAHGRRMVYNARYKEMQRANACLQRSVRCYQARQLVQTLRMAKLVVKLQAMWRRKQCLRVVTKLRYFTYRHVIVIQRAWRDYLLRRIMTVDHGKAIVIQTLIRLYLAKVSLERRKSATVTLNRYVRGILGRRRFAVLKLKAIADQQAKEAAIRAKEAALKEQLEAEQLTKLAKLQAEKAEQERLKEMAKKLKALEHARVELWKSMNDEDWSLVEHILDSTPDLAQAVEPSSGELPLHTLSRHGSCWSLLVDLCLVQYPKALLQRDKLGSLPLHHAAAHDARQNFEILYNAYKEGLSVADSKSRLALHVAAEFDASNVIKFILEKRPDYATVTIARPPDKSGGGVALHVACRHGAGIASLSALLSENFAAAKQVDANGDLPLHLLLRNGAVVDLVSVKTLLTCFPAAVSRPDQNNALPLQLAIEHECKTNVIHLLLIQFPSAAQVVDQYNRTCLFSAFLHGADDRTILSLINHAPEYVTAMDEQTQLIPIQMATSREHSPLVIHALLKKDMPIDITEKVRAQVLPHKFSWNHLLSNCEDQYHMVITKILQGCTQPQVLALAHVEDSNGKIALSTATPVCKHEIRIMLRLFNTLEIVNQRPAYTNPMSDTQIFYALRYDPPPSLLSSQGGNGGLFTVLHEDAGNERMLNEYEDLDDMSMRSGMSMKSQRSALTLKSQYSVEDKLRRIHREKGQNVIAKLTSRSDVVERELRVRKNYRLSRQYIPIIYSVHHTVQHAAYSEAMAEPGYCVTMEGADATAENHMLDMRNAGVAFPIKSLKKIGIALLHMHERGLIHGDFGTHNIGKFGKKWKLLGAGGSYRVGDRTDSRRGFYHPPESVDMSALEKSGGGKRRSFFSGGNKGSGDMNSVCIRSITADATLDIWAFGNVVYEAFVGAPLSPYMCRGKRPMSGTEYAKLGKWSDSRLKKSLDQLSEQNQFRDAMDIRSAKDLLAKIFSRTADTRIPTMRKVLEHPFFGSVGGGAAAARTQAQGQAGSNGL